MPPLVAQARAPQLWWRHSCDIEDKPAVTTATTYSTIDETLPPSIFVASVFEVVICARSVSVHSSDCHRTNRARRVVGRLLKMRSFFVCVKESICSFGSLNTVALSRMAKLSQISMREFSQLVVKACVFHDILTRRNPFHLNPRVRIWFQSSLVISVRLFGVVSARVFYCRSNQSFANGLLLRVCLPLSITVFGAPRQSHFRIVSKVVLLRFSFGVRSSFHLSSTRHASC